MIPAAGIDPGAQRPAEKHRLATAVANTFGAIGEERLAPQEKRLAPATFEMSHWMLDSHLVAVIGREAMTNFTAPMLLAMLRRIEARGTHETAHRFRPKRKAVQVTATAWRGDST